MSATCRIVSTRLPLAGAEASFGSSIDAHVGECLTCQAEIARYRKLSRALSGLAGELVEAPDGFAARVEFALDRDEPVVATGPRRVGKVATATGAIAATAAGVVAIALWRRAKHAA